MNGWKIAGISVIALILIGVVWLIGSALSVGGGYAHEGKRVISVKNVKEQNRVVVESYNSMQRAAENACSAAASQKQSGDPTLVEGPSLAYDATYRQIEVKYDSALGNIYEAQAVRALPLPSNLRSYPKRAPTLKQMERQVC